MSATNEPIGRASPYGIETTVPISYTDSGAHCAGSTGSGPLYPWPPSDFDVEQAIAWGRQKHYKREFGEDAMYAVLVWEIDRLRLLAAPNMQVQTRGD